MHFWPFLYGSSEFNDDLLSVRTPDCCSARDNYASTSLRGQGRRGGRGERGGEEEGKEKRGKDKVGEDCKAHAHTHTYTH